MRQKRGAIVDLIPENIFRKSTYLIKMVEIWDFHDKKNGLILKLECFLQIVRINELTNEFIRLEYNLISNRG